MFKHNTLLIVLFGMLPLSAVVFSMSTSPYAFAASKSLSPQAAFASPGIIQRTTRTLYTSNDVATVVSPPSTKVVLFSPSGIRGTLDAPADCWETSLAAPRANAWRCIGKNIIYDPCFSTSTQANYVICAADPSGDTRGLKAMLAHPLSAPGPYGSGIQAWTMRLSDGSVCSFYTGATGLIGGERINYGCTNGSAIVGSPRIGSVWMVKEMKKGQSQLVMTQVVEVWW